LFLRPSNSLCHDLNVLFRTLDFSLPSPVARSDISPARTYLASTIAHISLYNETRITYTDAPGSILHDPHTQTLSIEKLKVKHLRELLSGFLLQDCFLDGELGTFVHPPNQSREDNGMAICIYRALSALECLHLLDHSKAARRSSKFARSANSRARDSDPMTIIT